LSDAGAPVLLHAGAVAVAGRGVLILGPAGSGKAALALRMLALGAALVADDRVELRARGPALVASAPAALAGLVEARGFGILRVPALAEAPLFCAVDLGEAPAARLPHWRKFVLLDREIDLIPGRGIPDLGSILMVFAQCGGSAV
jgi:HPr kinase/phosphorylase